MFVLICIRPVLKKDDESRGKRRDFTVLHVYSSCTSDVLLMYFRSTSSYFIVLPVLHRTSCTSSYFLYFLYFTLLHCTSGVLQVYFIVLHRTSSYFIVLPVLHFTSLYFRCTSLALHLYFTCTSPILRFFFEVHEVSLFLLVMNSYIIE